MTTGRALHWRSGAVSFRIDRRLPLSVLLVSAVTTGLVLLNLGLGEFRLSPADVFRSLAGSGEHSFIVTSLRLPRALVAVAVGMGLGASGAILQALTRNPLAAPEIVGITEGANLAAVCVLILLPGVPVAFLPAAAFAGAAVTSAIVYRLAWRRGSHPTRLLLVGIGVAAGARALAVAVISTAPVFAVLQAVVWTTGSVYGTGWDEVRLVAVSVAVLLPTGIVLSRRLDVLQLGEGAAAGLGSRVDRDRGLLLLTAIALAATAVSVAGPIAFVGLLAPHIARRLAGPSGVALLTLSAVTGAAVVVAADTIGRTLFAPTDVPAGVLTPLVGVPWLIATLYREQRLETVG